MSNRESGDVDPLAQCLAANGRERADAPTIRLPHSLA